MFNEHKEHTKTKMIGKKWEGVRNDKENQREQSEGQWQHQGEGKGAIKICEKDGRGIKLAGWEKGKKCKQSEDTGKKRIVKKRRKKKTNLTRHKHKAGGRLFFSMNREVNYLHVRRLHWSLDLKQIRQYPFIVFAKNLLDSADKPDQISNSIAEIQPQTFREPPSSFTISWDTDYCTALQPHDKQTAFC